MPKATKTATPFDMMNGNGTVTPEALRENVERFVSLAGEFSELSREGLTAATESARVSAKAAQELNAKTISYFQDAMSTGMEAGKSVAAAKSVQEAMELQASYAKSAFDTYMKQCSDMASFMAAAMREASEPLNAHAGQMVEKMQIVK